MATEADKENIADGLVFEPAMKPLSPEKRQNRRTRSKSIGPGDNISVPLKDSPGKTNRRKSSIIPAVKSIISCNEHELAKRREERRKSLANRRVSFAPEATLHTWDVIEYMRDATTSSSASSEATRRASSVSQASNARSPQKPESPVRDFDPAEPPSTPPEQVESPLPTSSPANQREMHQKKRRRRSSGIPPMNFNNPDDVFSSSPTSASSVLGSDPADGPSDSDDDESTAMDLTELTSRSHASNNSSDHSGDSAGSSARLEEALRRAALRAGTIGIDFDENGDLGDLSMEMAGDEVTDAFQGFLQSKQSQQSPESSRNPPSVPILDQENVNPFSPAFKAHAMSTLNKSPQKTTSDEDMSMDMTQAIGRIVSSPENGGSDVEGATMDMTTAVGKIVRFREQENDEPGDKTMDMTVAVGGIMARRQLESIDEDDATMDLTTTLGSIQQVVKPEPNRRSSLKRRRSSVAMQEEGSADELEDMSMELTGVMGGINGPQLPSTPSPKKTTSPKKVASPRKAATPRKSVSPLKVDKRSASKSPRRSISPMKGGSPVSHNAVSIPSPPPQKPTTPEQAPAVMAPPPQPATPVSAPTPNRSPLINSIRRMTTPRKMTTPIHGATPLRMMTLASEIEGPSAPLAPSPVKKVGRPRKSASPQKALPPRRESSPRKRVKLSVDASPVKEAENAEQEVSDAEPISVQDFLSATTIRFMDLTTTKRRATGFPAPEERLSDEEDAEGDSSDSLEPRVVAAACILPTLEMYQHACHELKKDISRGKDLIRAIEANAYEANPPLFREYMSAPPEEKYIMDNQFKNIKTNARLKSKEMWYSWRSSLLDGLKAGLASHSDGVAQDDLVISREERLINAILPVLVERHAELESECKTLQEQAEARAGEDQEELKATREKLVETESEIEEKTRLIDELQRELDEQGTMVEAIKERKTECVEEIKAAERVLEECRGWSADEVNALKAKVSALESQHGWTVSSASRGTLTLNYLNDLQLFFHPSVFLHPNAVSAPANAQPNSPISLSYLGDDEDSNPRPKPLTTTKRFFLQLLRAHLHCVPQSETSIASLLRTVGSGWDSALAIAEGVRQLNTQFITEEKILSDERMAVESITLLPTLGTKVVAVFEIGASAAGEEDRVGVQVSTRAEVKYGERLKEERMSQFLSEYVGIGLRSVEDMGVWRVALGDLKDRLVARGKKGVKQ